MPALSKTGLAPSLPKKVRFEVQTRTTLDVSNIAVPAPYVLRPFAGIYNPFPYGCSVLCNHPADLEAKNVVKKAKDTWAIEGRCILSADDLRVIKCQKFHRSRQRVKTIPGVASVAVPEELFRRYTDTDSRPVTPAPTVISFSTKHSQLLKRRRCMTPDPVPLFPSKERTLLVLDLRRSHSQETITWIGSQQGESVSKFQTTTTSRTASSASRTTTSSKKKKLVKNLSITPRSNNADTTPKGSRNSSTKGKGLVLVGTERKVIPSDAGAGNWQANAREEKEIQSRVSTLRVEDVQSFDTKALLSPEQALDSKKAAGSTSGDSGEPEVVKRRGKRRKGKKSGNLKDGEKGFQGFPEPGETQVSALGNESRMGSTRPSLTATTGLLGDAADVDRLAAAEDTSRRSSKKESFLDATILKQLQRQLDHEVVESELDVKRKIALEEALRLAPKSKPANQNQEMKYLKKELCLFAGNPEKWLSLPRVFTRQSARFELPMDSRTLNDLTPLQYAERYVFPSEERLVLYNHVFNLHREEFDEDEDENSERILLGKNVVNGLGDIMGRRMTSEEARQFQTLLGWSDEMTLDFRVFTGISAICERLLADRFFSKMPTPKEDLKHEIERADFESLDQKLFYVRADERIVKILKGIRDS